MAITALEFWVVTRSGSLYHLLLTRELEEFGGDYILLFRKVAKKNFDDHVLTRCDQQEDVRVGRLLVVSSIFSFFEADERVCNTSYVVAVFETEREGFDCLGALSKYNRGFFEATWRDQTRVSIEKMRAWPFVQVAPGLDKWLEVPKDTGVVARLRRIFEPLLKRLPL